MRLLNVTTRQLEEYLGPQIPSYAILSHTWGEEEVLFDDIADPSHKTKKGYGKVEGCCLQAQLDGLGYVWIDTCCINKNSSAELSEAINSMFKWYEAAYVCYAYLADVPYGEDPIGERSAFRSSRWFTRGWTLQELIVPKAVHFFDSSWNFIFLISKAGSSWPQPKAEMLHLLESITDISSAILDGSDNLSTCPNGLKLSWASRRCTTKIEDEAYCLLGLLDVNLPLLYGEGSRATARLLEALLTQKDDLSTLAWGLGQSWAEVSLISEMKGLPMSLQAFRNFKIQRLEHGPTASHLLMTNSGYQVEMPLLLVDKTASIYLGYLGRALNWDEQKRQAVLAVPFQHDPSSKDPHFIRALGSSPIQITCRRLSRKVRKSPRKTIFVTGVKKPYQDHLCWPIYRNFAREKDGELLLGIMMATSAQYSSPGWPYIHSNSPKFSVEDYHITSFYPPSSFIVSDTKDSGLSLPLADRSLSFQLILSRLGWPSIACHIRVETSFTASSFKKYNIAFAVAPPSYTALEYCCGIHSDLYPKESLAAGFDWKPNLTVACDDGVSGCHQTLSFSGRCKGSSSVTDCLTLVLLVES